MNVKTKIALSIGTGSILLAFGGGIFATTLEGQIAFNFAFAMVVLAFFGAGVIIASLFDN